MFLNVKVITERQQLRFSTLSTNNQGTDVCISLLKCSKKAVKNVNTLQIGKSKVEMIFFEF